MTRPKIKTWQNGDAYLYATIKRDGMWVTLDCIGDMQATATSRRPTDLTLQLVTHEMFDTFRRRAVVGHQLYCELYAPGHPQSEVKHLLAIGDMSGLRLECFAVGHFHKSASLEACRAFCHTMGIPFTPFLSRAVLDRMSGEDEVWEWATGPDSPDSEGIVYKDANLLNWRRRKAQLTADLVVTGHTQGRGKYLGLVGALECGLWCQTPVDFPPPGTFKGYANEDGSGARMVCACSGMTDEQRLWMSENRLSLRGRVVEVSYQYVGANGGLRHPQFKGFRDDKRPEECTKL